MFYKKGVPKNFAKFPVKHLCQSLTCANLQLFKKRDSDTGVSLIQNTSGWVLLKLFFQWKLGRNASHEKLVDSSFCFHSNVWLWKWEMHIQKHHWIWHIWLVNQPRDNNIKMDRSTGQPFTKKWKRYVHEMLRSSAFLYLQQLRYNIF